MEMEFNVFEIGEIAAAANVLSILGAHKNTICTLSPKGLGGNHLKFHVWFCPNGQLDLLIKTDGHIDRMHSKAQLLITVSGEVASSLCIACQPFNWGKTLCVRAGGIQMWF